MYILIYALYILYTTTTITTTNIYIILCSIQIYLKIYTYYCTYYYVVLDSQVCTVQVLQMSILVLVYQSSSTNMWYMMLEKECIIYTVLQRRASTVEYSECSALTLPLSILYTCYTHLQQVGIYFYSTLLSTDPSPSALCSTYLALVLYCTVPYAQVKAAASRTSKTPSRI